MRINTLLLTPLLVSLGGVLVFNGCAYKYAEAPLATNFPTTEQKKLQSAHHWQVISSNIASSIFNKIEKNNSIYVTKMNKDFKFASSFRTLIISELVNNGMKVSLIPTARDTKINISVETIKFSPERAKYARSAGSLTMLSAGLWAIYGVSTTANPLLTTSLAVTGTAIGTDIYNWNNSKFASGSTPQHEIIVTVSASRNNKYLANYSNIYYIADSDSDLYEEHGKTIKLVGN